MIGTEYQTQNLVYSRQYSTNWATTEAHTVHFWDTY